MLKSILRTAAPAGLALLSAAFFASSYLTGAAVGPLPDPQVDMPRSGGPQTAVFAGGCFWCTEAVFEHVQGVTKVLSGYAGGDAVSARYDIVSAGKTTHAESIQITFDPARITYGQLLKIFFAVAHDPTQKNRQGPDYGKQYRSAIFYQGEEQKRIVEAYIGQLREARSFSHPIVTEVSALQAFYPAEEYHQDFVKRNPNHPYVVVNAIPKLDKLKKQFPQLYKK
ncbi:MAG TPA: peptide-methionine (S)-S-oxide reductase MsrA [Bryobacteraceae bacterium]|jgi:peptide-methionine (S)-S-oxide reductase|nr:peptide-methionine (S)-S-oxide reductase MsrA [Bryobacteraceae bacterium]